MSNEKNWVLFGCGVIAHEMAEAMKKTGRHPYAIWNRTKEKALKFQEEYGLEKVYDTPEELLSDPDIDIVYITTPHNTHIEYAVAALKAGKHVLCEKSIFLNYAELMEAESIAKSQDLVLAEAMTIFHMPLYKKLLKRLSHGDFGPVNLITLNFGSYKVYDMKNRFFNKDLAGGAMLDIGVYALSLARIFLKSSPEEFKSIMKKAPSGSDENSATVLMNPDGQMVTMMLSMHSKQPKRAVISCDKCYVEIMEYPRADKAKIVWTETGETEEISEGNTSDALSYEIIDMEKAVSGDKEIMRLTDTTDVMRLMTGIRLDWGYFYDGENAENIFYPE